MQKTSMDAYLSIKRELGNKQQIIFDSLKFIGPATNENMALRLNWPINRVTPRMGELRKLGMVKQMYEEPGKSGKMAIVWGVNYG